VNCQLNGPHKLTDIKMLDDIKTSNSNTAFTYIAGEFKIIHFDISFGNTSANDMETCFIIYVSTISAVKKTPNNLFFGSQKGIDRLLNYVVH
jgi:hypothetical protein